MYKDKRDKTQKKICFSFLKLLKQKDKKSINVVDICKEANINRGTFYKYFMNSDELYKTIKEQNLRKLFGDPYFFYNKHQNIADAQLYLANHVFHHIFHNKHIFEILMLKDTDFKTEIYNYFKQNYIDFLSNTIINNHHLNICDEFLSEYIAGAYTSVIYEWVRSDCEASPKELTKTMIFINSNGPISILTNN